MLMLEALPTDPIPFYHTVYVLPIPTCMSGSKFVLLELAQREVAWLQGDIGGTKNPLAQVVEAVMQMLLYSVGIICNVGIYCSSYRAQTVHLMEHCNDEHSVFRTKVNIIVSFGRRP